jgi:hypothetical protein
MTKVSILGAKINAEYSVIEFLKHPSWETGIEAGMSLGELYPNPFVLTAQIIWYGHKAYFDAVTTPGTPREKRLWAAKYEAWKEYRGWLEEMALKRQAAADAAYYRSLICVSVGWPRPPRPDISELSERAISELAEQAVRLAFVRSSMNAPIDPTVPGAVQGAVWLRVQGPW